MQLFLVSIFFFLVVNFLISVSLKKYTYDKFFIYVVSYFILINFINLIYLKNINLFTFQSLFSVIILFVHSALYRSVSVKIIVYLYLKKANVSINSFYKTEFKEKSFNKRVKILIDNGYLIKKNKYLILSARGENYLKVLKIFQSIYKIKFVEGY